MVVAAAGGPTEVHFIRARLVHCCLGMFSWDCYACRVKLFLAPYTVQWVEKFFFSKVRVAVGIPS